MARVALVIVFLLAFPAAALADGSGGAVAAPSARGFKAAPASVKPGAKVTFAFRATPGARVRVDLLAPGASAVRVRLGRVGRSGKVRRSWKANLAAGAYTARLVVSAAGATRYVRLPLTVIAPAPPAAPPATLSTTTSKTFPVQGPFNFGGELSRFGAGRTGHIHQGQDIAADEGTPVVSPIGGMVHWVAYQAQGAGHYVVIAGDDGRHYVFMHLQAGSIAVTRGARVEAGQQLAAVGSTGGSDGPHLHFEIWVNGWWASDASAPIDPLPELQAWAAGSAPAA